MKSPKFPHTTVKCFCFNKDVMGLQQEVDLVESVGWQEESEVEPAQLEEVLEELAWYLGLLALVESEQESQNLEKVSSSHVLALHPPQTNKPGINGHKPFALLSLVH